MENTQTSPSVEAILTTVREMPIAELEQLVDQVLAIRAERVAPHLTADESALLARINHGLPAEDRDRMRALIEKRDEETITTDEWRELAALTDRLELLHADRLAALAELAKLRGVTLDEVMSQLGIQFPDHDEKYIPASPEERARAVEEWANQHRSSALQLPDTAISRDSIYGDREDRQL